MSGKSGIARLFVGIEVPLPAARFLARIQPEPVPGIGLISPGDMHVTLHFLGSFAVAAACEALAKVGSSTFPVRIGRADLVSTGKGKRILWAEIEPSAGLLELHRMTALALADVGFLQERRPFRPHVTLARLKSNAPRSAVRSIDDFSPPDTFECRRFVLYASVTRAEGARYEIVDGWPLQSGVAGSENRNG